MFEEPAADWLWHGFVSRRSLTLLTGLWKSGKTTLLSLLLARRHAGGTLAGQAVCPGKTAVVSEENALLWAERTRRLGYGGNVCFFTQPFNGIPEPAQWQALIARILQLHEEHGVDLAVIDPLAPFFRNENNPKGIFDTLAPLAVLQRAGMAVLAIHHPTKGQPGVGQAARGSGALLGHVDISIEMRHPGGDPFTRRRRLLAFSRYRETPRQLLAELNPEATDYIVLADEHTDEFQSAWDSVRPILEAAARPLSRQDILELWPDDADKPSHKTLWKWLDRAVGHGLLDCAGGGRKTDPFRYWLPKRQAA
jgi:hypothetical protein